MTERGTSTKPVIIFDGDDTLWETEPLYDRARCAVATTVSARGLDPDRWDLLERVIDVANVERFGLSAKRFPTSCVEAYRRLASDEGLAADQELESAIWEAANSVFSQTAPLMPGAREVLSFLGQSYRLVLLTQGDIIIQRRRIEQSGLVDFFEQRVIVERKSSSVLSDVLHQLNAVPESSWVIGNSIPSDINPAIALSMNAIWLDTHVWEHEKRETLLPGAAVLIATSLLEVPMLLRSPARA